MVRNDFFLIDGLVFQMLQSVNSLKEKKKLLQALNPLFRYHQPFVYLNTIMSTYVFTLGEGNCHIHLAPDINEGFVPYLCISVNTD